MGRRLRLHHDVVAVVDEVVDHALAAHAQDVGVVARLQGAGHVERLGTLGVGLDRLARGNLADHGEGEAVAFHRHPEGGDPAPLWRCRPASGQTKLRFGADGESQGSRGMRAAFDHTVPLEGGEMVMDGRWRGEADRLGDLSDAGRVAALRDDAGDGLEDLLAALGIMPGHRRLLCWAVIRVNIAEQAF